MRFAVVDPSLREHLTEVFVGHCINMNAEEYMESTNLRSTEEWWEHNNTN